MSNPDRGAYTPPTTDQPLSFDARQPVRGRGPAPMMLFASALVLFILVAAIVVFYRSGVSHGAGAPPVVGTPIGSIKGPAPAESQPSDPAQGLQIYQQAEGQAAPSQPNFVAPPEQPQARINPTAPTPAAPAPSAPVAALPSATPGLKPSVTATAPVVKILPPATPAPAPVAAKPAPQPQAKPVASMPAKAVAAVPAKPAPSATVKPPAAKPIAAPTTAAAKPPAPKPVAAASGAASVQIGAFSSQALADKGWNDAAKIAPGAAAGKGKKVEAVPKGGSTLYRTTVTGFGSRAAATAFCDQLKAAGKSCFVK